ncbi:MAG: hypothetical protein ABR509_03985 [Candidatus Limnocylindria bacterium]
MSSDRGYHHEKPHRPSRLPRRLEPPPERQRFDISWMIYIGIGLALVMAILIVPYLIAYLINLISS